MVKGYNWLRCTWLQSSLITGQSHIASCPFKHLNIFNLVSSVCVCLFCFIFDEKWMTSYIKWELISRGFPNHTISNLFIAAEHYIYINACYVLLLNTTYISMPAMYCC